MNKTPHNFNDEFNIDLPGEIEDLHDENCGIEIIDSPYDWNDENDAPDFDEESMGADGDFYDDEDDSWSDSDSLASCGWGTDEDYGLWE
tara:strand:- start:258 stop:524 length:267 start_codon:yes stop_codon:yes gene_type:complete